LFQLFGGDLLHRSCERLHELRCRYLPGEFGCNQLFYVLCWDLFSCPINFLIKLFCVSLGHLLFFKCERMHELCGGHCCCIGKVIHVYHLRRGPIFCCCSQHLLLLHLGNLPGKFRLDELQQLCSRQVSCDIGSDFINQLHELYHGYLPGKHGQVILL